MQENTTLFAMDILIFAADIGRQHGRPERRCHASMAITAFIAWRESANIWHDDIACVISISTDIRLMPRYTPKAF